MATLMRVDRCVGIALFVSVLGWGYVGHAQTVPLPRLDRSFDMQLFHPAVGTRAYITLDSADVLEHTLFHVGVVTNYARSPFSYALSPAAGVKQETTVEVVRNLATAELVAAMGLFDRFEVGLALPFTYYLEGDTYDNYARASGGAKAIKGLGDLRVEGKSYLTSFGKDRSFVLGASLGMTLPTGDDANFLGEKTVAGRGRLLLEFLPSDSFRAVAMVGGLARGRSEFLGIPQSHALLYGAAAEYRVNEGIAVVGEGVGRFATTYYDTNPAELNVAMRFSVRSMVSLLMGAGAGLNRGLGAPTARAFLGLSYAPDFRDRDKDGIIDVLDRCPDEAEDRDGYQDDDGCPDLDNDYDGIPDSQDKCPMDPEDMDNFQDDDGCPDLDNDQDGIPDVMDSCPNEKEDGRGKRPNDGCPSSAEDSDGDGIIDGKDQCPDEPEDKDGFQDEDGCPDFDNDADGIPDIYDACPNDAEDRDGFEDNDGCPDLDNDKDGIPDSKDKCPNQPETFNGKDDEDGCPDSGPELVRLLADADRLLFREPVKFEMGEDGRTLFKGNGEQVLSLAARILKAHPELVKLRVDVRGEDLTKEGAIARAQMVVDVLVKSGVESQRVKPWGLPPGPSRVDLIIEARGTPKKVIPPASPGKPDGAAPN